MPSVDTKDPTYRRLWYVRYADDFLLGYIGTKQEAETIKEKIGEYLKKELGLDMSKEKTLITNAYTERAKFLSYEINRSQSDNTLKEVGTHTRRTANARRWYAIPNNVVKRWENDVTRNGEIIPRKNLMNLSDDDIIMTYEVELQGVINYYGMAHNMRTQMGRLRYLWQESLLRTLAAKHKIDKPAADRKYRKIFTIDGRRIVGVEVERDQKKP